MILQSGMVQARAQACHAADKAWLAQILFPMGIASAGSRLASILLALLDVPLDSQCRDLPELAAATGHRVGLLQLLVVWGGTFIPTLQVMCQHWKLPLALGAA